MSLELFKSPLIKLETLIRQLEINTGQPHRESPFEGIIKFDKLQEKPAPPVKEQQIEKKVQQEQPEKKEAANPKQQQPKQQQPKGKPQVPQPGPQIPPEYQDIANVDIRVGEFVKVWKHPESENLYCEHINIGTEVREIASGLQKFIPIEEVTGLCLVLVNLKGRKLAGFMSNGMVLCASNADHTKVEILKPAPGSVVGERVKIQGKEEYFKDALEEVLNPKKKNWENAQPLFKVDQQLQATWNGQLLVTSAGPIKAQTLADGSIS